MQLPSFFGPSPEEIEEQERKRRERKRGLGGLLQSLRRKKNKDNDLGVDNPEERRKKSNKRALIAFFIFATATIGGILYCVAKINENMPQEVPSMKVEEILKDDIDYYINYSILTYDELFYLMKNKGYNEEEIKYELDNSHIDWENREKEANEANEQSELAYQEYEKYEEERIKEEEEKSNNIETMKNVIEKNTNIKFPSSICIAIALEHNGINKITYAKVTNSTTVIVISNNVTYELNMSQGIVKRITNQSNKQVIFDGTQLVENGENEDNQYTINGNNITILIEKFNMLDVIARRVNTKLKDIGLGYIDNIYMLDNDNETIGIAITESFMFYKIEMKNNLLQKVTNMYTNEELYVIPNEDGIEAIKIV